MIIRTSEISCSKCIYYEKYHQFPNPNAFAKHYCKKCNEEIKVNNGIVFLPKLCYINNYFEETKASKREKEAKEKYKNFYQIED